MADVRDKQLQHHHQQQQQQLSASSSLANYGFAPAGGDLFDGLPLDYAFLHDDDPQQQHSAIHAIHATATDSSSSSMTDAAMALEPAPISDPSFSFTPRMSAHLLATIDNTTTNMNTNMNDDDVLFDHDVAASSSTGLSDDLLTPLPFAFPQATTSVSVDDAPPRLRYHAAPQHRHKRVKSNPDVLFTFANTMASGRNLAPVTEIESLAPPPPALSRAASTSLESTTTKQQTSPMRPHLSGSSNAATRTTQTMRNVPAELANAVFSSILNDFQDPLPGGATGNGLQQAPQTPPPRMRPIGVVDVMTPIGLHDAGLHVQQRLNTENTGMNTGNIENNTENNAGTTDDTALQDMDAFLQDLSWAELSTVAPSSSSDTTGSFAFSNASSQDDQLHPHALHAASPVAYRTQRIQSGVHALQMKRKRPQHTRAHSNPVDLLHNLDQFRLLAQQTKQQQHLQQLQETTPQSLLYAMHVPQSPGVVVHVPSMTPPTGPKVPPRAAARRAQRSSGLSVDMSQMNLGFLSVPEEPETSALLTSSMYAPTGAFETSGAFEPTAFRAFASSDAEAAEAANEEANRKLYKCGRCGQPKVGHVCTMPDQRNNWTQVDLDVTKGVKVMRINCHILPVQAKWKTLDDENIEDERMQHTHVSMFSV